MSAVFEWRDAIRRPPPGRELPPLARWVALCLSFYMDTDSLENARPGSSRLAAETGLSVRTVKSNLAVLTKAGWIRPTRRGGPSKQGGKGYLATTYKGEWPIGTRVLMQPTETGAERALVQDVHQSGGAGDAPALVQDVHEPGAGDAPHLVHDLDKNLVCVAISKLNIPKSMDTQAQEDELEVKLNDLRATHGDEAVADVLVNIPDASIPFAGELVKLIKRELPTHSKAWETARNGVERWNGYVPGHTPSAKYPHAMPTIELDDDGNAYRVYAESPPPRQI